MSALNIKGVAIGEGAPKVVVPVVNTTAESILSGVKRAVAANVDAIEWRADYAAEAVDASWLVETAKQIASEVPETPLLFTIRTASQGGNVDVPAYQYATLLHAVIEADCIDMVDIEINMGDVIVSDLVECAHKHGVATVLSYHNFTETPDKDWMVDQLVHMHELGGDIPKMAVMAQSKQDTLALLAATDEVVGQRGITPVLTMAMGADGVVSRLLGEVFGSALTFSSLEDASAPGQLSLMETRTVLRAIHVALA